MRQSIAQIIVFILVLSGCSSRSYLVNELRWRQASYAARQDRAGFLLANREPDGELTALRSDSVRHVEAEDLPPNTARVQGANPIEAPTLVPKLQKMEADAGRIALARAVARALSPDGRADAVVQPAAPAMTCQVGSGTLCAVRLRNGGVVVGEPLDREPDVRLVLRLRSNRARDIAWSEIASATPLPVENAAPLIEVTLTDGSAVKGQLIEIHRDVHVSLLVNDHDVKTIRWSGIEMINLAGDASVRVVLRLYSTVRDEQMRRDWILQNSNSAPTQVNKPWGPGKKVALAFGIIAGLGAIGGAAWGIALANYKHY